MSRHRDNYWKRLIMKRKPNGIKIFYLIGRYNPHNNTKGFSETVAPSFIDGHTIRERGKRPPKTISIYLGYK